MRGDDKRDNDLRNDDLRAAMTFFAARLRGVELKDAEAADAEAADAEAADAEAADAGLLRWTRHKLRNDMQAVAELMLIVGYRPTFIRYFLRYHIVHTDPETDGEDVTLAVADLQSAASRLRQPYRDLAKVCFRWGYVHETVVQMLAKTLERKPRNVVED